jgi:type II secretory pathway pseudopilin PulG
MKVKVKGSASGCSKDRRASRDCAGRGGRHATADATSCARVARSTAVRCRGFLLSELIVTLALLGLIIAGLVVSMNGFALVNDYQWARQRCTAAARAQLDSLAATGRQIEPPELQRLWPGVEVTVDRSPGVGSWEGLDLVRVTASAQPGPRKITVSLVRYGAGSEPGARGFPVDLMDAVDRVDMADGVGPAERPHRSSVLASPSASEEEGGRS